MSSTVFVSPYTFDGLDRLKLAALYFDRIELRQHQFCLTKSAQTEDEAGRSLGHVQFNVQVVPLIAPAFAQHLRPLADAGLVDLVPDNGRHASPSSDEVRKLNCCMPNSSLTEAYGVRGQEWNAT